MYSENALTIELQWQKGLYGIMNREQKKIFRLMFLSIKYKSKTTLDPIAFL